ncbi:DUF432 domain-containing protein [bacterium]|nr:DUF432 domain-containing protein [bacterium]MBU1614384.1 DUF432 domain-containing protein [bacterium]
MTENPKVERRWGEFPLPLEVSSRWEFGPLQLWCKTVHNDFWIAYRHQEPEKEIKESGAEPPEEVCWSRWALKGAYERMRISPLFPDLPVVVKPEATFILTPQARTKVYVRCPLWIRIELVGKSNLTIEEIPTVALSKTWFGEFADGELCYWISSAARSRIETDPGRLFMAICPIHITNQSKEELIVEKICLRVGGLSLFDSQGQLWAGETKAAYYGSTNFSQVEATQKPPAEAGKGKLITPPRNPARKNFTERTFASLKSLPGMGLFLE